MNFGGLEPMNLSLPIQSAGNNFCYDISSKSFFLVYETNFGGLEPMNLSLPIQFVGNNFVMTFHLNHFF